MNTTYDCNGDAITTNVQQDQDDNWTATVWFGSRYVTDVRRYTYLTRRQARQACISDTIGERGRVA